MIIANDDTVCVRDVVTPRYPNVLEHADAKTSV